MLENKKAIEDSTENENRVASYNSSLELAKRVINLVRVVSVLSHVKFRLTQR